MKRLIAALFSFAIILAAGTAAAQTAPNMDVLSYPSVSSIFDPVILTARITDPEGLPAILTIHGTVSLPDLGFTGINLDSYSAYYTPRYYDDGTHGDAVAGDGIYTFSLDILEVAYGLGASYGFSPEQIDALIQQFAVEDIYMEVNLFVEDAQGNDSNHETVAASFYNPSPHISEFIYPQLVGLDDVITIALRVTDPDDDLPLCLQVHGTVESPDFPDLGQIDITAYPDYFTVYVCDDGVGGDLVAGDDMYTLQSDLAEAIANHLPPQFADYMLESTLIANFWVYDDAGNQSNAVTGQADIQQTNPLRPIISDLTYPNDVLTTDVVTVSMTVTDPDGDIPAVIQLHGTINSSTFPNAGEINVDEIGVPVYMYDDGSNGDLVAGDHIYTHTVNLGAAIAAHLPAQFATYLTEGIANGRLHVVDEAGHWSNIVTASVHYDNPNAHRPVISEFTYPSFVLGSDTIMATARITDEDGDITHGCILVHASGSSPTFPNLGTIETDDYLALFTVHMCDDGRQGDVTPGDGIYTITEKPSDHYAGVPAEFRAYLTDALVSGQWWVFDNAGHQSNTATGTVHFYNPDAARPVIGAITFPDSMTTNDSVRLTAAITDANGDLDPCLRIHGTISSTLFPELVIDYDDYETYMCDNGTIGDAIAGDGIYTYQENMLVVLSYVDPALLGFIGDGAPLYGEMWVFDQAGHQSNVVSAFSEILNPDAAAPVISNFVFPASATATDTITVSARIADANADLPACVTVHGTVFSPTYPNLGVIDIDDYAADVTIKLCDNGTMGDATSGDGIFTHVVSMSSVLAALPDEFRGMATDAIATVSWWVTDLAGHQSNTVIGTSHFVDNSAHRPVISDYTFPTFATTYDTFMLSARITDADGDLPPDVIVLYATATSPTFPNLGEIPFEFNLFDNGTNGDATAHDGLYSQRINMQLDVMPFLPAALVPYATDLELSAIGWVFDNAGHQSNVVSGTTRVVNPDASRPVISDFSFPSNVEIDDTVRITARIADADHDLPGCVLMHGTITSPTFPEVGILNLDDLYPMVEIELCDNGTQGDNIAGDGIFTVERSIQDVMPLVPAAYRQYLTEFNVGVQWWVFDNAGNQSNVVNGSSHFYNPNPVIASVTAPASAGAEDTIFITALIVDADGDLPARIQVLGQASSPTLPELGVIDLATFVPILLYDDGTNGDLTAGDGIYSRLQAMSETLAYLPPIFQPYLADGVVANVSFHVVDLAGHASNTWNSSATWVDPDGHAPVVTDLTYPANVDTDDLITLSVRVADADGDLPLNSIQASVAATSLDFPELGEFPETFYLFDNATHGDAVAHDGIYTRQIDVATGILPVVPVELRALIEEGDLSIDAWVFDLAGHRSNTVNAAVHFLQLDIDGDGVYTSAEVASGCMDPNNPDTDGDGLADGVEDADHDGVVDPSETSACLADTDGDLASDSADLCALNTNNWTAAGCSLCADGDSDGFWAACDRYFTITGTDCDDAIGTTFPGAAEICDLADNDCDTVIDNGVLLTFYRDADVDNFGNAALIAQACTAPAGFVADNTDCDDASAISYPGAAEICDLADNDCDTVVDNGVLLTFYRDADTDSFGNATLTSQACSAPAGFVTDSTDCDDASAISYPGAVEICDLADNDCDTVVDNGVLVLFFSDSDSDNYGNAAATTLACAAPAGYVADDTDCNDGNAAINPGAAEICDTVDNNCGGGIDEGVLLTFYQDFDTDGFGNVASNVQGCSAPMGYVASGTDCNDGSAFVYPGAVEICDSIDNQCPGDTGYGQVDENPVCNMIDADGDGLSDALETIVGSNPNDPDTDDDSLLDGPEYLVYGTDPLYWDTDLDALPDGFEVANMTGHAQNLDPTDALDGEADFDLDTITNSHDYWNGQSGIWLADLVGFPSCGYWAEGDGDGFISPGDMTVLLMALKGNLDYSPVYPGTGETQDLDADGFLSPGDRGTLGSMIKTQSITLLASRPETLARVIPATGISPNATVGDTIGITVAVSATYAGPASSVPVVFTIDSSSTATATILGGEGENVSGTRYDLTLDRVSGGTARVVLRLDSTGTVVVSADVLECGLDGAGRYSAAFSLAEPVVITVSP